MEEEIWKEHPIYNTYLISNTGKVKSKKRNKILNQCIDRYGYYQVPICYNNKKMTKLAHRLVCETFLENLENKPQVNHIDCNKLNNNISNLEWCTCQENIDHSMKNRLRKDTKKIYVLDTITGVSRCYYSVADFGREIGVDKGTLAKYARNGWIYKKRYNIKYIEEYSTTSA